MSAAPPRPSAEKILLGLYDRILAREITEISQVIAQIKGIELDPQQKEMVLQKAFIAVRAMSWGVFADMNPRDYKYLWNELVLPQSGFKAGGDLKRNMTISSVFIAMLDIHGYTAFCRESKNNLSQLQELDNFVNTGIKEAAKVYGCIGTRERGDEIILIGARANDIISASFAIIQIFAREKFFKKAEGEEDDDDEKEKDLSESFNRSLPPFNVSAGITGGNSNSPMIITKKGEISGFLLNSAARLQTRANKLAPKTTKIIIAKTVHTALKHEEYSKNLRFIKFFDCGSVEFKGTRIAHMEIIFREQDMSKLKYESPFQNMLTSLEGNLWKDRVFLDCLVVIKTVLGIMPPFNLQVKMPGYKFMQVSDSFLKRTVDALSTIYNVQNDYITAIKGFDELTGILEQVPGFEPAVLEYMREIRDRYTMLLTHYEPVMNREVDNKKGAVLTPQELKVYEYFRTNSDKLEELNVKIRNSPVLTQRKILWNSIIENKKNELDFNMYSGKK
ncbi:MAG: hypothetical protein LBC99_08610 [Spirochaetota bacterium]|jgi:hypothetical protein|nr:hypothetical protein [Spirochaetota bacterium]